MLKPAHSLSDPAGSLPPPLLSYGDSGLLGVMGNLTVVINAGSQFVRSYWVRSAGVVSGSVRPVE